MQCTRFMPVCFLTTVRQNLHNSKCFMHQSFETPPLPHFVIPCTFTLLSSCLLHQLFRLHVFHKHATWTQSFKRDCKPQVKSPLNPRWAPTLYSKAMEKVHSPLTREPKSLEICLGYPSMRERGRVGQMTGHDHYCRFEQKIDLSVLVNH